MLKPNLAISFKVKVRLNRMYSEKIQIPIPLKLKISAHENR